MGFSKHKWHKVADTEADIKWTSGDVAEVVVDGKKICMAKGKEGWFGFADTCPHAGAPMIDAYVTGGCQVVCPVHQLKFNLKNGRDVNGGGYVLKTYPIELRSDGVFVGMPEGRLFKKWF